MASCALALCLLCASPWKIKISRCCCCIGRHSQHPHAWRSFFSSLSLHFTIIFLGRSNLIIIVVIIAQLCMNDSLSLALAGSTLRATQSIIHTELQLDWKSEINTNFPISHVIISNLCALFFSSSQATKAVLHLGWAAECIMNAHSSLIMCGSDWWN